MAVGRRASISLFGAGLPGHFLLGVKDQPGAFLDPFAAGSFLTTEGCRELFRQLHGVGSRFDDSMLAPVDGPAIIERMLNNLLAIFRSDGDIRSQLWVSRLRSYLPGATITQRADVAVVLANGGQFDAAAEIFEALALSCDGETGAALLGARDRMRSRMN
jgi:regulator of sirC expression with transglutaminase-like and TPR domain